jgi:hypothetical protein
MIARSACMLALVIAWSGYLAGLNWLTASPDPWLVAHKNSAQPVAKKRATSSSIEAILNTRRPVPSFQSEGRSPRIFGSCGRFRCKLGEPVGVLPDQCRLRHHRSTSGSFRRS